MLSYQIRLHLIVIIFGFTGILGKLILLPAESIVLYRMSIACLSLGILLLLGGRKAKATSKNKLKWFLTGFVVCIHWFTFFHAIKLSNVSVGLVCMSSTALFTSILEPIFLKKKVRLYEILFSAIIIASMAMILSVEFQYVAGIIFGLISAALASLFTVLNSKYVLEESPIVISFYELMGGAILVFLYLFFMDQETLSILPSFNDFVYLFILAILATAIAFVVSIAVMKKLSPFTVSLTINLEPLYGIVLAVIIFGSDEYMSPAFYTGFAIILSTIFMNAFLKKRERKLETKA